MGRNLERLFGVLPIVLAGLVLAGAVRLVLLDSGGLPSLAAETFVFGGVAALLAWPLASVRPFARATHVWGAVPAVTVGVVAGALARGHVHSLLGAWVLGVVVTALAIAPRLAVELDVVASSTRRELVDAAISLGATTRQARRLAADAGGVAARTLGAALALGLTDGVGALAAFRIVGVAHPLPAGVALLTTHAGGAVLVVVLATSLSALRGTALRGDRRSDFTPLALIEAVP